MSIKNSNRSGGPKTSEGKLIASQNSLKTGSYSKLAVLPNENPEEFNQLLDQFIYDLNPADIIETSLVRELAVMTWKKMRLERLENDFISKQLNLPIKMEDLIECGLNFDKYRYEFWLDNNRLNDEDIEKYTKLLALIKPHVNGSITVAQLEGIISIDPSVHQSLIGGYRHLVSTTRDDISNEELVNMTSWDQGGPDEYLTATCFTHLVKRHESALWCTRKQNEIDQAVIQIKQERIFKLMQSDVIQRANDDLSRSISRVSAEFRKHRQWRMQYRVIDANEE